MRTLSTSWPPFGSFLQRQIIQSGAKKKKTATFWKSFFSYLYLSKYTILYTKLNTIGWTLWWWKLYQKIFYDKYFISLWKRPLKNTSHKKRHFQGKRRNSFLLRVERKETRNQNRWTVIHQQTARNNRPQNLDRPFRQDQPDGHWCTGRVTWITWHPRV